MGGGRRREDRAVLYAPPLSQAAFPDGNDSTIVSSNPGNPSLCAALLLSSETISFLCPAILKGDNGFLLISGLLLYPLFVPLVLPGHMK